MHENVEGFKSIQNAFVSLTIDLPVRLLFSFHSFSYFFFVLLFSGSTWMNEWIGKIKDTKLKVKFCVLNPLHRSIYVRWQHWTESNSSRELKFPKTKVFFSLRLVQQTLVVPCNLCFGLYVCVWVCVNDAHKNPNTMLSIKQLTNISCLPF